jgi:hypothetical protein
MLAGALIEGEDLGTQMHFSTIWADIGPMDSF